MKLSELLKSEGLSLSFEVFPPKTDSNFESVKRATEEIASLGPAFMSVTYGAGGGTSRYTLDIAKNIKERYSVPTLAHLTCVSSTKETVRAKIGEMRAAGIENVMALRGDLTPELRASDRTGWAYRHAIDLVRELKEAGHTMIVVTHEMKFAREVADRVVFFADGNIEEQGSPEEVFDRPKSEVTRAFFAQSLE